MIYLSKIWIKKKIEKGSPLEKLTRLMLCNDKTQIGEADIYWSNDGVSQLNNIYVDEKYQNKGYASRLVKNAIKDIDSRGDLAILSMATDSKISEKAKHLYVKNGFESCGNMKCKEYPEITKKKGKFCYQPFIREGRLHKKGTPRYNKTKDFSCNT